MPGSLPIRDDKILVSLDSKYVYIYKDVFKRLFENSHVYYLTDYKKAFSDNKIKFRKLVALSRKAGIPYSLFFAPIETVEKNIKRNGDILFQGVSEGMVSIAGRGDVRINDVKEAIERLRKMYPVGSRIELVSMNDPFTKLVPGDKGTVTCIDDIGTIHVRWDCGSSLGVAYGEDVINKI